MLTTPIPRTEIEPDVQSLISLAPASPMSQPDIPSSGSGSHHPPDPPTIKKKTAKMKHLEVPDPGDSQPSDKPRLKVSKGSQSRAHGTRHSKSLTASKAYGRKQYRRWRKEMKRLCDPRLFFGFDSSSSESSDDSDSSSASSSSDDNYCTVARKKCKYRHSSPVPTKKMKTDASVPSIPKTWGRDSATRHMVPSSARSVPTAETAGTAAPRTVLGTKRGKRSPSPPCLPTKPSKRHRTTVTSLHLFSG